MDHSAPRTATGLSALRVAGRCPSLGGAAAWQDAAGARAGHVGHVHFSPYCGWLRNPAPVTAVTIGIPMKHCK